MPASKDDFIYHYKDYIQHVQWVSEGIGWMINKLLHRMLTHDRTKVEEPELSIYAEIVPGFRGLEYGTQAHKDHGDKLGPAWAHHVEHNKHHPEHFPDGINNMTLIDLVEMVCDWRAASLRNGYFDYETSVEVFAKKFANDSQLISVIRNTCRELNECGEFPSSQRDM